MVSSLIGSPDGLASVELPSPDITPPPPPAEALEGWRSFGLIRLSTTGRRLVVAGLGAACALGLGAATAYAVRLPSDLATPQAASDQMLLQEELPSVTAARTYALDHPPTYAAPPQEDGVQSTVPDEAVADDDSPTKDPTKAGAEGPVERSVNQSPEPRLLAQPGAAVAQGSDLAGQADRDTQEGSFPEGPHRS